MAVPYTGHYSVDGNPGSTPIAALTAKVYTTSTGGSAVWTSPTWADVAVNAGRFQVLLDQNAAATMSIGDVLATGSNYWLEFEVDGVTLSPRQQLLSVARAVVANDAATLGGLLPSDYAKQDEAASLNNVTAAGAATVGGYLDVGANGGTCVAGGAGTLKWETGKLSICDGSAWRDIIQPAAATLAWSQIVGLPAGFADGVDDEGPQYFPGTGLYTSGAIFHISDTFAQRRITGNCPTGAISRVNLDGSTSCVLTGGFYSAAAGGGASIQGSTMQLMACSTGQILKWAGGAWTCANDSNIATFADVGGTASDAQIPDNVTVAYAQDADMVDGHHYDPLWDSTDATTLNGKPASEYGKQTDVTTLQGKYSDLQGPPPSMDEAYCATAMPTRICKRDVFMWSTHTRDENSLMMLKGGTWRYYAAAQRCEYDGGKELLEPQECGQAEMPAWMETSDECGGFRQSTWDTRVFFAVSDSTIWDPYKQYACPDGYRPMTTAEGNQIFDGVQNGGAFVYQEQCGWSGSTWMGKTRTYWRFGDSAKNNWSYKFTGDFDGQTVRFGDANTTQFAGTICIRITPPGPTEWMLTDDACGGWRQSVYDGSFYFAVSRKNVYDPETNYQCPAGYHWATTQEAFAVFNKTTASLESNGPRVYVNQCGWSGYDMHPSGSGTPLSRHNFRFADSYKNGTTLATMHAGWAEERSVQFDIAKEPVNHVTNPSYFAGIVCKADANPPASPTAWMDTSDFCGGWRQDTWDPRFRFAVAKSWVWSPTTTYQCPAGFKWATRAEWQAAHQLTSTGLGDQPVYSNQCGWSGSNWNNSSKLYFRFADSGTAGPTLNWTIRADRPESYLGEADGTTTSFAGIVCMQESVNYPNTGTTDWMQTDDDCKGFRPMYWDPRIRFAVARQNVWNKAYPYQCPAGYHWATTAEVDAMVPTSGFNAVPNPGTTWRKYGGQCGWTTAGAWQGRIRQYFRFADSAANNRFWDSTAGETAGWGTDGTLSNFAGIVCIQDAPVTDPMEWWDRSDNCAGWRKADHDGRVRYMTARKNIWDPNRVYQCPSGYHWMTTAEWDDIRYSKGNCTDNHPDLNNANGGFFSLYRSNARCGWSSNTWRGFTRFRWRFSDSYITGRYAHGDHYDSFHNTDVDSSTASFAGIVCVEDNPPADWWMDKTDNCGGWRQSQQHPDVYYAAAWSEAWNRGATYYTCPAGFTWPTWQQYDAVVNSRPKPSNLPEVYHGRCGRSGTQWNPRWRLGCNSYTAFGCGTDHNSPMPSMWEYRMDQMKPMAERNFASGCAECENYDQSTACQASGLQSGADGKCGGRDEVNWRNGRNIRDCFTSPNVYSGNPTDVMPGAWSDHTFAGVACGDGEYENRNNANYDKRMFRFSNSYEPGNCGSINGTNRYIDANSKDGVNTTASAFGAQWGHVMYNFGGIVCIRNGTPGL